MGLNLESTVSGGTGSSFAVGNTRMGRTRSQANDPSEVKRLPNDEPTQAGSNETATRIPSALSGGGGIERPRFIGDKLEPEYPEVYRSQNLEADVTVRVKLDRSGKVVDVRVVTPSVHEDFNVNAMRTARKQRFTPARQDGEPIPWTLTYTYRFELEDT
ncbi:MAG: energy transducer TonB [Myxococcota bacterium]